MSDTPTLTRVRDHRFPCEHEDNRFGEGAELLFDIDEWVCKRSDCPGGRERTYTTLKSDALYYMIEYGENYPDEVLVEVTDE